jgi:hypothetical protein
MMKKPGNSKKRSKAMISRRVALVACFVSLIVLPGCNDAIDDVNSPVFLTVAGVEPNSEPFGDVYNSVLGAFMPDTVQVTLSAHFANQGTPPTGTAYTTVQLSSYRVTYHRTDNGAEVPAGFQGALTATVEAGGGDTVIQGLTICQADQKLQPPLYYLTPFSYGFEPGTGYTSISCNCVIDFYGHTLAGEPVSATGAIAINFADYFNEE